MFQNNPDHGEDDIWIGRGQDLNLSDNSVIPTCEAEEILPQIETRNGKGGETTIEGKHEGSDCDP